METKNFGIYNNAKRILFYAVPGTFASDAWRSGDEERYNQCSGNKFTAITADDGKEYNIGRRNIERISKEEFKKLFDEAPESFKLTVKLMEMKPSSSVTKEITRIQFFMMNGVNFLLEEGFTPEEIEKYFVKSYI